MFMTAVAYDGSNLQKLVKYEDRFFIVSHRNRLEALAYSKEFIEMG